MRRGGGARARQRIGARGPRRAAREQLVRGAARPAAAAAVRAAGGGARRRRAAAAVAARGIGGRGGEGAAGAADARAQRSQRRAALRRRGASFAWPLRAWEAARHGAKAPSVRCGSRLNVPSRLPVCPPGGPEGSGRPDAPPERRRLQSHPWPSGARLGRRLCPAAEFVSRVADVMHAQRRRTLYEYREVRARAPPRRRPHALPPRDRTRDVKLTQGG